MRRRRRRRKIPVRTQIRRLEKKADRLLSLIIRARAVKEFGGKCPFCKENPIEVCFHFISRKRKILRWSLLNVIGACSRCNWRERYFPDLYRAWLIRRIGVRAYLAMVDIATESISYTVEEMSILIESLLEVMEEDGKR